MTRLSFRSMVLTLSAATIMATPFISLVEAASTEPPPPPVDDKAGDKKKPGEKSSGLDNPVLCSGYRAAYAAAYERQDYAGAIAQLKALGRDENADVANLIGFAYRKLDDYRTAQIWYERALRADPTHIKTWQYYGLWQLEQGNRDQARYHLQHIGALGGTQSEEYRSLAAALERPGSGY